MEVAEWSNDKECLELQSGWWPEKNEVRIWPEGVQCQFWGVQELSRECKVRTELLQGAFLQMEGKSTIVRGLRKFCCYHFVFSFR